MKNLTYLKNLTGVRIRWWALAVVITMVLGVLGALALRANSRQRLEAFKAELLKRGEKLDLAALVGTRMTQLSNSVVALSHARAQLAGSNLSPGGLGIRRYVAPGEARPVWMENPPGWDSAREEAGASWEEIAGELKKFEAPLAEIRQALRDPDRDWTAGTNALDLIAVRMAAQWLSLSAISRLQQGQLEKSLQDLEAVAGLARINGARCALVDQMFCVAVTGLGLATTWEALQASGWSDSQFQRLGAAWETVDVANAAEKGAVGELAGAEELWATMRQADSFRVASNWVPMPFEDASGATTPLQTFFVQYIYYPAYRMTGIDADELRYLRTMQESLQSIRSLKAGRSWSEARQKLEETMTSFRAMTGFPAIWLYPVSSSAVPNLLKAFETSTRMENERQLALAAIALARYKLAHGVVPASLHALVGEYLPAVPRDLMSGNGLGYHLSAGGDPVLYSVGMDGLDDGGDPSPSQGKNYGLWEGSDAVWPSLAPETN